MRDRAQPAARIDVPLGFAEPSPKALFRGSGVGAVHGAELGLRDLVFGIAVDGAEPRHARGLEILHGLRAVMEKIQVRGVDIALETLEPVAVPEDEADIGPLSGICSAAMSGSGGTLAASPM